MSCTINGEDVLKLPESGVKHRSENLADFVLESHDTALDLTGQIYCKFKDNKNTDYSQPDPIHFVYPNYDAGSPDAHQFQVQLSLFFHSQRSILKEW